jgi:hypothetical protein
MSLLQKEKISIYIYKTKLLSVVKFYQNTWQILLVYHVSINKIMACVTLNIYIYIYIYIYTYIYIYIYIYIKPIKLRI